MGPRNEHGLIAPDAMRAEILAAIRPLAPRSVQLDQADGLVLASPLVAGFDLPRFSNAAMDGFALRSADTLDPPVRLELVGRSLAGRPARRPVGPGQAMAIATGAVVPDGADAIVPVEEAQIEPGQESFVTVRASVAAGTHVRPAGEDIRTGDVVLTQGTRLGPGQVAAAAALGASTVTVHPRPTVAVLPTGDEIRSPGEVLDEGQVFDSVSAPLALLIREVGGIPVLRPPTPDDTEALLAALLWAASEADAILTVGGVSMGPRDLLQRLPAGHRIEVSGFRLALRPAKPFGFGWVAGVPLFGLPGNPGSALASFEELVRPVLLAMMGMPATVRSARPATLAEELVQKPGRLHLIRAEVWRDGARLLARPAGDQRAGMIHSLARANGWMAVPPEIAVLAAGSEVEVRLLTEIP